MHVAPPISAPPPAGPLYLGPASSLDKGIVHRPSDPAAPAGTGYPGAGCHEPASLPARQPLAARSTVIPSARSATSGKERLAPDCVAAAYSPSPARSPPVRPSGPGGHAPPLLIGRDQERRPTRSSGGALQLARRVFAGAGP